MKVYVMTFDYDGEVFTSVFGSHLEAWLSVESDAERAATDSGESLPLDPSDWPEFIVENGWKIRSYGVGAVEIPALSEAQFDMTPRKELPTEPGSAVRATVDGWPDVVCIKVEGDSDIWMAFRRDRTEYVTADKIGTDWVALVPEAKS